MIPVQAVLDYREVVKLINIAIDESSSVDANGEGGDPYVETMGVNRYRLRDFYDEVPSPTYANAIPSENIYENDNPNTRMLVKDTNDEFRTFTVDLPFPVLVDTFDMLEVTS